MLSLKTLTDMIYNAKSPEDYIDQLPYDRKHAISMLRNVILENLPSGFEETIVYNMIGYVIPRGTMSILKYHCHL
jgi:hypothetical protein